tara:strand:+ start:347 stop:862 length:516 start_codon:yes stop_codon:yes gene_type:complete
VINRDILENQVKYSYISIGSNLGNRKGNIEKAKFLINQNHIKIIKISSIYESLAWPNNNDPKFFNLVIKVSTFLNPTELLRSLKFIEKKMGRKKAPKNSPRICDIDIIDYNGKKFKNSYLEIPHPRMKKRDFVLLPLMEICSNWTYPRSKMKISSILNNISEKNLTSIKIL